MQLKLLATYVLIAVSLMITGCSNTSSVNRPYISLTPSSGVSSKLLLQHDRWKGTPYKLGGTSRSGIDCSAFTQISFRELFNIELPRTTLAQLDSGQQIARHQLRPGDLVFFLTGSQKQRHVGIFLEQGVFLHASTSRGVVLSRLDNPYWSKHYWTARRPNRLN